MRRAAGNRRSGLGCWRFRFPYPNIQNSRRRAGWMLEVVVIVVGVASGRMEMVVPGSAMIPCVGD